MKNSWLSKMLPKDEYKEKKMVYFLAESAVIFMFILSTSFILSSFNIFNRSLSIGVVSLIALGFFITYILIRYIISGIEHTEIVTEIEYKKKRKAILQSSLFIMIGLIVAYAIVDGFPSTIKESLYLVIPAFLIALLIFFIEFISLKKSYNKNKSLID